MQIKSWQIALAGLLPLLIGNIVFIFAIIIEPCNNTESMCGLLLLAIAGFGFLDFIAIVIISFLRSENKKHLGAVISVAAGILILGFELMISSIFPSKTTIFRTIIVLWISLFLIAASIYYFKVESKISSS